MKKVMALIVACAMIVTLAATVAASGMGVGPEAPVAPETGTRFVRVDEHFGKWSGSGTVSCRIDTAPWRFERLDRLVFLPDSTELYLFDRVASANFEVREGRTIITLSENYLKTLTKGIHWFEAEFWVDDKGLLKEIAEFIMLEIPVVPVAVNPGAGAAAGAGAGGGTAAGGTDVPRGGVALAIIPTFLAAGVALAASKKRK